VGLSSRIRHRRARLSRLPSLQGPSRSPRGEWCRMTGTGPEETPAWLPRRALVLGLARSGHAAALALARRGVSVVAADRSAGVDAGRLSAAGVEGRGGSGAGALLEGVGRLFQS